MDCNSSEIVRKEHFWNPERGPVILSYAKKPKSGRDRIHTFFLESFVWNETTQDIEKTVGNRNNMQSPAWLKRSNPTY